MAPAIPPATKNISCTGQPESAKNNNMAKNPNNKPTRKLASKDRLLCVRRNHAKLGNTKRRKAMVEMNAA